MYQKILAAVNEHLNSEITARYALSLAAACKAKLYFSFVAERGLSRSDIEAAERAMKRLFLEARDLGIAAESNTETGEFVQRIEATVRQEKINLVFASTRREDAQKRFYAGTQAQRLSLHLPCSVALVRVVHAGKLHPSRILVPLKARIDHIQERAFFTAKIAEAFHSEVWLFHAPAPLKRFFHGEVHLTTPEWENKLPQDVSEFKKGLEKCQIRVSGGFAAAAVGRGIVIEAASWRHDLIILGASRRNLLSSWFKGNPVEDLLRAAPSNLIILKPVYENT